MAEGRDRAKDTVWHFQENQGGEGAIHHRSTTVTRQKFGVYAGGTIRADVRGTVAGSVLSDPEAFAVGVDSRQVDGAAGAASDESEGVKS